MTTLKVNCDPWEPWVKPVQDSDTPEQIHAFGCGIVAVEDDEYDAYIKARTVIHAFEKKTQELAVADMKASREYGDFA